MAATLNGHWAHAVPLDRNDDDDFTSAPQRVETFASQDSDKTGRTTPSKRTSDTNPDAERDATAKFRRPSVQSNSNTMGPRKRPSRRLRQQQEQAAQEEHVDDSAWIHRDKLAQIEIQEMEEAGMHVRQPRRSSSIGQAGPVTRRSSRSMSRSGARRPQSRDQLRDMNGGDEYNHAHGSDEFERKRVSTIPAAEEDEAFDPTIDSELRTPEEVAAEQPVYRQPVIRPTTSRIPISKASPVPVPHNVLGRESPSSRSRSGSNAVPTSWDDLQYAKRRSGSFGSGVLLDDADGVHSASRPLSSHLRSANEEHSPHSRSPPKSKLPHKDSPISGARKVTTPAIRAASGQRPPSSSSSRPRPSTSHNRPEGEAPWIATMYKPDPRLPPDQQILPTHAKRMLQEQWEKEGKTGTAYDRDFRLLNDEEFHQPSPPSGAPDPVKVPSDSKTAREAAFALAVNKGNQPPPTESKVGNEWTAASAQDKRSDTASPRPGTSGGYRITPTITTPTPTPTPPPPSAAQQAPTGNDAKLQAAPAQSSPPTRVPDLDEKDEAKPKKGCCCAMM